VANRDSAREIDDQAAEWAIRLDGRDPDLHENAALAEWLRGDPRREGALLRAEAALSFLDRGRALSGVIPRPRRAGFFSRRRLLLAAASMGALAAGLGGALLVLSGPRRYTTELGEVRLVPLADGSHAAINTHSVLEVAMKATERDISLTQGEAWFEVAKDPTRPFVVRAGRVRVRALGTAFSVRRRDDGAEVLVTEGTVATWVEGHETQQARLAAGSRAFVGDTRSPQPIAAAAAIDRSLAWRDGQIALEGETLADAAVEFNRYNAQKLVIEDPALAQEKLVGQFRMAEPMAFARAVASTLGATVVADPASIRLSRNKASTHNFK
jgi:transmembrane sensor